MNILQKVWCDCQGLRPTIPKNTHPKLAELLERLWEQDPTQRPDFTEIIEQLQEIAKEVSIKIWIEMNKSGNGRVRVLSVSVCVGRRRGRGEEKNVIRTRRGYLGSSEEKHKSSLMGPFKKCIANCR